MRNALRLLPLVVLCIAFDAAGQSSSLMRAASVRPVQNQPDNQTSPPNASPFVALPPAELSRPSTKAIESVSMIAIPPMKPRKFKTEDLITIIVRQQKKYEADAKLDTEKKWDINGKLSEWFRIYPRNRLGSDKLSNGDPSFKFNLDNKYETDGENNREDKFTTRITAKVIDVKPNGNLVLEARNEETHDEEVFSITLTGTCRSEDVLPDNTVLSTQIGELVLVERNRGAVRDATTRGWIPKVLDFAKPF